MAFLIVTGASGVNPDWTAAQSATGDDDTEVQQAVRFPRNIQECHGAEFTHTGAHRHVHERTRAHTNVCVPLPASLLPGGADSVPTGEGSEAQKLSG